MRGCFYYVLAGLLLAYLDFSINGLDLLPDFLGWAIVGLAALQLKELSPRFVTAGCLAWAMATIAFVAMFGGTWLLGLVVTIVGSCFMWTFLGGIAEFSVVHERSDFAERAATLRNYYVVLAVASEILGWFMYGSRDSAATLLVIGIVLAWIVVVFMILRLIYRAGSELLV